MSNVDLSSESFVEVTMTNREFAIWASEHGAPEDAIKEILQFAASPEEMRKAFDAMLPAPPVYTLTDIVEMTDNDPYGISARANDFIVVGGCLNGDPIAIDVGDEPGSVWYICHETMHGNPVREVSVCVAANLTEMIKGIVGGNFPYDYFMAKERESSPGE